MHITILNVTRSTNGLGEPFDAITFTCDDGTTNLALVFANLWHTAVLDLGKLPANGVAADCWRDDVAEPVLRSALHDYYRSPKSAAVD